MLQNAVELIQLFSPGGAAKNGADIKLCLDATEDIGRFAHIGIVIVVGGDSDFMPVSQKIKAAGRTLIGVGTRKATNRHWAKSCHEFRYYENLVEVREEAGPVVALVSEPPADVTPEGVVHGDIELHSSASESVSSESATSTTEMPVDLVRRALRLLAEKKADAWVNKAEIWPMVKRLDPTFELTEHGHTTVSGMLKALSVDLIEIRKGENDQQVRLR